MVAVIVNNLKSSRDMIELKKQKRKKTMLGDLGSKGSLKENKENSRDELNEFMDEQHNLDHYYPPFLSMRLKELVSAYYMNLASLDNAMASYQKQQKILDDLIDIAKKNQDKDSDY